MKLVFETFDFSLSLEAVEMEGGYGVRSIITSGEEKKESDSTERGFPPIPTLEEAERVVMTVFGKSYTSLMLARAIQKGPEEAKELIAEDPELFTQALLGLMKAHPENRRRG